MINTFGKFVRQLRIRRNMLMKDMANDLQVSAAFLSAVESGTKAVPSAWQELIEKKYDLGPTDRLALDLAIAESKTSVTLNLSNASNSKRSAVVAFARKFDDLSDEDLQKMLDSINR